MILCGFTNYSFELRGQDEYYMVKFGYFTYTALKKNLNYIEFNEQDTKTRIGKFCVCCPFIPKMWSTPGKALYKFSRHVPSKKTARKCAAPIRHFIKHINTVV